MCRCGNTTTGVDADNTCDVNSVSSPDNIAVLKLSRTSSALVVAEDTTGHQNDVAWLVNPKTSECIFAYNKSGCNMKSSVLSSCCSVDAYHGPT